MITRNYLAGARVLAASHRTQHPDSRFTVLVVDDREELIDAAAEPFDLLRPADIAVPGWQRMAARYSPLEFVVAFKPWLLRHLLRQGANGVAVFDADVRLYGSLDQIAALVSQHDVVMTPHLTAPLPRDDRVPREPELLVAGAYNAGCFAAGTGERASAVLDWWGERLLTECVMDVEHGLHAEQRWLDLIPTLFPGAHVLRDPGCNVAYWNVGERPIGVDDAGAYTAGGRPLRFFHFTGFQPRRPRELSRFQNRLDLADHLALAQLCADYAVELLQAGHETLRRWPYGFGTLPDGTPLDKRARALYVEWEDAGLAPDSIFDPEGAEAFLAWLNEPAEGSGRLGITRYLERMHRDTPELRAAFPQVDRGDGPGYARWLRGADAEAAGVPPRLRPASLRHSATVSPRADRRGLRRSAPGEPLGAERGEAVVCIPVYGAHELFVQCLRSVLAHTPAGTTILIADDATPDPATRTFIEELGALDTLEHDLVYARQPQNVGFVKNVNAAFAAADPGDVVVLNSDCVVGPGWLEGLQSAAYSGTIVATASALTNNGQILSIPDRNSPRPNLPQHIGFEVAVRGVREHSLKLRPRIPTAIGHCMYVRRSAIELVGDFDIAFSPGYGEEVDFSQRCLLRGLEHVVADDVFVLHHGSASFGSSGLPNPIQAEHDAIVNSRYPYYADLVMETAQSEVGPFPRALSTASRAVGVLTLTIDASSLGPSITGTQIHALELIAALARTNEAHMRIVVPRDIGGYAREALDAMPQVSELLRHDTIGPGVGRTAIAHRPQQINHLNDLGYLRWLGERVIITQQDLIGYHNPGYFRTYAEWEAHRRLARQGLAMADRVAFFSSHVAADAIAEELIDRDRATVAYIGVDHHVGGLAAEPVRPIAPVDLTAQDFLLCIGTDFRHKNRPFAIELLAALRDECGWQGRLVLAGAHIAYGSSAGEEAELLAARPDLADAVVTLPAISEAEKSWLLRHCRAVVYPTVHEGFGLVPFEAADAGAPCLFAPVTSLVEVLPEDAATLVPWDASASARRAIGVLREGPDRERLLAKVRTAARSFRWDQSAAELIEVYREALRTPIAGGRALAFENYDLQVRHAELQDRYWRLWDAVYPTGLSLVGPDGALPKDVQLALLAATQRRFARIPLYRLLKLGFGMLRGLRRLAGARRHPQTLNPAPSQPQLLEGKPEEPPAAPLTRRVRDG